MPKSKDIPFWVYLLFWLVPPGLAAIFKLSQFELAGHTTCLIYQITGVPCLSCGSTRALDALLDGNLLLSLQYNPLPFILLMLYAGFLTGMTVLKNQKRSLPSKTCKILAWSSFVLTLIILVIHWIWAFSKYI